VAATQLPPKLDPTPRDRVKSRADAVPAFALYGEPGAPGVERLHLESIASRSQRYRWEIDAHRHHGLHQILWLRAGAAQVCLDEQRQSCSGPAVVVIPPGVVHAFSFEPHTDGCVLTFSADAVVESDLAAAGSAMHRLFAMPRLLRLAGDEETPRLEGLINQLADEFSAADSAGSPVPLWLARSVVWRLAQWVQRHDLAPAAMSHQALFTRFAVLIEDHYTEHWPVARYADQLGLSLERLNRLVRTASGGSALERIHQRLAREACRRLIYVAAPISQLAFELGFDDPAYFCRFFRRRLGCSPSSYRQRGAAALSHQTVPAP
jgi:AraC family transcriptional activator of pobA